MIERNIISREYLDRRAYWQDSAHVMPPEYAKEVAAYAASKPPVSVSAAIDDCREYVDYAAPDEATRAKYRSLMLFWMDVLYAQH